MWERFPPRMRKMIAAALEAAAELGHEQVHPEHLLIAITRDPQCAGAMMLSYAGLIPKELQAQLDPLIERGSARLQRASRLCSGALHVLDIAVGEADRLRDRHVGTEHVALALARTDSNPASELLARLGFTLQRATESLKRWHKLGMPRNRQGIPSTGVPSRLLARLPTPLRRLVRLPALVGQVYIRKSLGHPRFVTNPYPLYRWLREHEPVRRDPIAPVWVLTRYDDTMLMLRDPRFKKDPFASERLPKMVREQLDVPVVNAFRSSIETVSMLFLDPPEHTRIRSIFTKAFTPRRLESLRPRIQKICDDLLDRAAGRGHLELMGDLAAPLPVTVIAELLGFPAEDYQKIKRWSDDMAEALGLNPSAEAQARAAKTRDDLRIYFDRVVARIKRSRGDNLLGALLASDVDVLTREELFTNSVLLLAAGHETTTHLIGNGLLSLLQNPDQLRDLRAHPDLIDDAIEEILRFNPPVQWTSRVAGQEIELRGQRIGRGEIVLASVGAANRDPRIFADPDRFDIRREENRHLSFGVGPHFCLGAALARMEGAIAIQTILKRFPNLQLQKGRLHWQKGLTFRGLKRLPLIA